MKHVVSLSIFLVLAIIALWSITSHFDDRETLEQIKDGQYAEIFMNEFEMTVMNEFGNPGYILQGAHLQRDAGSDETEVKLPVFQLIQDNNEWKISADQAAINYHNKTIQLKNNVLMQQQNIKPAVTIRTRYLLIHTETQVAQTKAPVDIRRGNSRLQSDGMVFNNISSELELSSNVNGYYLPHD